jgi:hypothetical protein
MYTKTTNISSYIAAYPAFKPLEMKNNFMLRQVPKSIALVLFLTVGLSNSSIAADEINPLPPAPVILDIKVNLQGPLNSGGGLMNDGLRASGHIPLTEPYTGLGYTHVSNPGGETTTAPVLAVTGPDAIVDWVFVSLRSNADPTNVVHTRAGLLQRDGDVVDVDGTSFLSFPSRPPGQYYVSVEHRNHLGIMTLNSEPLEEGIPYSIDFISGATPTYGSFAQKNDGSTGFMNAMWAGDASGNKLISLTGVGNDPFSIFLTVLSDPGNLAFSNTYQVAGYHLEDINMDGLVTLSGVSNDPFLCQLNVILHPGNATFSQTFQVFEQLP